MINKSFKLWIILFVIINLLLLVWSLGYFKFIEEKLTIQDNIIVIEPDTEIIKSLPPKDESFPNEKSKVWGAFKDKKNSKQILQSNTEEEINNNRILKDIEPDNVLESKKNESIDKEQFDINLSKKNQRLEKKSSFEEKELKSDLINNNDQINDKSINNENIKEKNSNEIVIFYVQVASFSNKDLVEKEWNRLKKKHSKYITDLIYITQKVELKDNRVFFRLLIGKFMSKKDANNFCDKLNINKCIVKKNNE